MLSITFSVIVFRFEIGSLNIVVWFFYVLFTLLCKNKHYLCNICIYKKFAS